MSDNSEDITLTVTTDGVSINKTVEFGWPTVEFSKDSPLEIALLGTVAKSCISPSTNGLMHVNEFWDGCTFVSAQAVLELLDRICLQSRVPTCTMVIGSFDPKRKEQFINGNTIEIYLYEHYN